MGRLSGFRYRDVIRRLKVFGFVFDRQAAGSHGIWFSKLTRRYAIVVFEVERKAGRKKWRKISLKEVEETLTYPNRREKLPNGKVNAFKFIGAKLIRVTYLEKKSRMIVISVVDKNR